METLLLVDDDVSLLESLTLHFEDAEKDGQPRFQVVTATTAAAGLEMPTMSTTVSRTRRSRVTEATRSSASSGLGR